MRIEEIGTRYERRMMWLYIVSSPENIARLDAIRQAIDKLQRQRLYHRELPE